MVPVGLGHCLGAAVLVKQVAVVHVFFLAPFLVARSWSQDGPRGRRLVRAIGDLAAFAIGLVAVVALAVLVLFVWAPVGQRSKIILFYGRALATDTLADPFAPPAQVRWLTGNADLQGRLPWPFGKTDYLVWWGPGAGPSGWLPFRRRPIYVRPKTTHASGSPPPGPFRLVSRSSLPGLYWQHYYLLPIAGVAIVVAVCRDRCTQIDHRVRQGGGPSENARPGRSWRIRRSRCCRRPIGETLASRPAIICSLPRRTDDPLQGGRQWVVLRDGAGAGASGDLGSSSPLRLGLAGPAQFYAQDGQPDPPLLRRQPARATRPTATIP